MDIIINIINVFNEKFYKIDNNLINLVLSKLDFKPNHYKIIRENNKILIKCHCYYININKNIDNCDEIKQTILEYKQPMIYSHTGNSCLPPPQYYNDIVNNITNKN